MKKVEDYVRSIPDFPEPGIIFRDITTVLQDPDGLKLAIDGLKERLDGVDFDVVVGAESRGFIFGAPLAYEFGKGFVPVRKKGKLPCETVCAKYDLEYGSAEIEMHKDSIKPGQKVVVVDDDRNRRNNRGCHQTDREPWRRSCQSIIPDGAGWIKRS